MADQAGQSAADSVPEDGLTCRWDAVASRAAIMQQISPFSILPGSKVFMKTFTRLLLFHFLLSECRQLSRIHPSTRRDKGLFRYRSFVLRSLVTSHLLGLVKLITNQDRSTTVSTH